MRAIRVASAVLLGAGALASCVPTAYAADRTDFGFSVEPSTVEAGGRVTLRVDRNAACKGEALVSSPVFDLVAIPPGESSARAVVDRDAKPAAAYDVDFVCDDSSATARLTIARGRPTHHPTHHPTRHPTPHPSHPSTHHSAHHPADHHRHPSKGAHAGEGGTLAGFDLKEIGLGAALIAGALGTTYHLARRRTDEDAG